MDCSGFADSRADLRFTQPGSNVSVRARRESCSAGLFCGEMALDSTVEIVRQRV
jgi:hypothetical protein